ncbi:hypothetical protein [Micromonospora sp. WMMD710]|uniref:hypothetical protein n=1 Tax=Micromonospora sp. WMMD710 TaxID=3016085 RepID=UPI0024171639|nr:hypothetical protein [Micromonospora sp. WMMD710]MDG4762432.1 hypothetical protein [Micromonospora sp. WMMD710]
MPQDQTPARPDSAMPDETQDPALPVTPPATAPPAATAADARVRALEAEVAELREQLATADRATKPGKATEPRFTFAEGQRDELERTGRTVSPFTGKLYVGSSPEDAREATADEYAKAKPPVKSTTAPAAKSAGGRSASGRRR